MTDSLTVVAVCPTEGEYRYRSLRPHSRAEAHTLDPADFEPLGDQPPAERGTAAKCHACGGSLVFRFLPSGTAAPGVRTVSRPGVANGQPIPGAPDVSSEPVSQQVSGGFAMEPRVNTLLALNSDEQLIDVRPVPGGLLVITSRRIVVVN